MGLTYSSLHGVKQIASLHGAAYAKLDPNWIQTFLEGDIDYMGYAPNVKML